MAETSFITPRLSPWLDLIRVIAAFAVLAGHGVQLGLYSGPWPFTIALQQNAVIIFFTLSGLVIASSVDSRPTNLRNYALARVFRILPVALPALVISLMVSAIGQTHAAVVGSGSHPDTRSIWDGVLPAMFFMSESYRTGLWINPPFWSLCYEVWFYAIFAAATFLKSRRRLLWTALLVVIAGPNILLLLPVWLLGVWIARTPAARVPTTDQAYIRIAIAIAALLLQRFMADPLYQLLTKVAHWNLGFSLYSLSYLALGVSVALGLSGLRKISALGYLNIVRFKVPIRFAANISFSLYLLHWPLITLLRTAGVSAGTNLFSFAGLLGRIDIQDSQLG